MIGILPKLGERMISTFIRTINNCNWLSPQSYPNTSSSIKRQNEQYYPFKKKMSNIIKHFLLSNFVLFIQYYKT